MLLVSNEGKRLLAFFGKEMLKNLRHFGRVHFFQRIGEIGIGLMSQEPAHHVFYAKKSRITLVHHCWRPRKSRKHSVQKGVESIGHHREC